MQKILVIYYSQSGSTAALAHQAARGVEEANCEAVIRQIPPVYTAAQEAPEREAQSGAPYVRAEDLQQCDGLLLGSPVHFGMLSAAVKHFLDQTSREWLSGTLEDKPAGVFTSSSTLHGGQEMTLMSLMVPLIHHGCLIVGVPYSEKALEKTELGGTPYGPSHVSVNENTRPDQNEARIARSLGKRVALWAHKGAQSIV